MIQTLLAKIGAKTALVAGIVVLVLAAFLLTYCTGKSAGSADAVKTTLQHTIAVDSAAATADANASEARVADVTTIASEKRDLDNAIKPAPAAPGAPAPSPDAARIKRGCTILLQQHTDISKIPACRGFKAGS